jgi:dipeptidyl aminopeptidase/acylaminoacyl peptidase
MQTMRRLSVLTVLVLTAGSWLLADQRAATPAAKPAVMPLTVDSIMRGPALVGTSPSNVRWSKDSSKAWFSWQKAGDERSATFVVNRDGTGLRQLTEDEARTLDVPQTGRPDRTGKRLLTSESGDVVVYDAATGARTQLTRTATAETNPRWARNDTAVTFQREGNLYLMALGASTGPSFVQLTDIVSAEAAPAAPAAGGGRAGAAGQRGGAAGRAGGAQGGAQGGGATGALTESQRLLREQELQLMEYLKKQNEGRQGGAGARGGRGGGAPTGPAAPPPIARFTLGERQTVVDLQLSADEKYVWIGVNEQPEIAPRSQQTPAYVTQSAYPEMLPAVRPNVGDALAVRKLAILDVQGNKHVWADAAPFAGREFTAVPNATAGPRIVNWGAVDISPDGAHTVIVIRSQDNKDRWFVTVDPVTGAAKVLDGQHDDAWIREQGVGGGGGFGGGAGIAWLPDNKRFLFLSEKTGYLHLYSLDMSAAQPAAKALTSGNWEVTNAQLSNDRTKVFLQTNEVHPGERHFYTMSTDGGARTKVTTMEGSNDVTISPDEKTLAVIHSYSTKPPELHMMPFTAAAPAVQVTTTPTEEFRAFKWMDPKVITYKARDGKDVYARLYTPEMMGAKRDPKKPAVVFVHGAGYLQNAHKYWSTYYREYMFHHILASKGYVVLDPDYRASSGYGRDWRTGIYRFMGGKDLEDVVDGAKFLVAAEKVDPKRIGVYGGSYGGFITLMALFTTPDVFAAGAALRPVTDWSHYNHGYTSNILNTPQTDPEAYRKSSPILHAAGLKNRLLILHGMVDTNVFFQDSVRLAQRLIELRKENWELMGYPVENHGFTEETSWADEYKRILKLFEEELRGVR